jgi:hypothetical protein
MPHKSLTSFHHTHAVAGYGTIEYRPEDQSRPDVHGVLLDLSKDEMKALAMIEGGYDVLDVTVNGPDGQRFKAKAFTSNWSVKLFRETRPTHDYIKKLREGAEIHNLPTTYQVRPPTSMLVFWHTTCFCAVSPCVQHLDFCLLLLILQMQTDLLSITSHRDMVRTLQEWLEGIESRSLTEQDENEESFTSPASYLAIGFSALLFVGAVGLLAGPRR